MGVTQHGRTQRLDLADPSLREWDCVVLAADPEQGIVLDRSAFYPGGGGQPPDCLVYRPGVNRGERQPKVPVLGLADHVQPTGTDGDPERQGPLCDCDVIEATRKLQPEADAASWPLERAFR